MRSFPPTRLFALALLCVPCASCRSPGSDNTVAVRSAVQRYYDVLSAREWSVYRQQFWPGAALTTVWQAPGMDTPGVVATTIEDFLAHTSEGPGAQPIFEEHLLAAEITVVGDLATVWARYEAFFGVPEAMMQWRGVDVFTWMRHDGEWRITSIAYQSDHEPDR